MATLDRTRDYATVHGAGADHSFVQDGKKFDHKGEEVVDKNAPVSKTKVTPAAAKVAAKAQEQPANAQLAEQLKG